MTTKGRDALTRRPLLSLIYKQSARNKLCYSIRNVKRLLFPICWVLAPIVQHGDFVFFNISCLKCLLNDMLVIGEGHQLYMSLSEGFLGYWKTVSIRGYHTHNLKAGLTQSCYSLQRRAACRDKVFYNNHL